MRAQRIEILFFIIASFIAGHCHSRLAIRGRIIAGNAATRGQFPYFVALKKRIHQVIHGGGSLISEDWILTAAHVVVNLDSVNVIFDAARNMKRKKPFYMTATNIYAHPGFTFKTMANDIALVRLPKSVRFNKFIRPISLPNFSSCNETFVGSRVLAMGLGHTSDNERRQLPKDVQYNVFRILGNPDCAAKQRRNISDVVMCGTGATCNGDSGGPVVMRNPLGVSIQIGIISYGLDIRCELPVPVGLTRITAFLNWINEATGLVRS